MIKELAMQLAAYFASTITAVGVGTLAVMGTTLAVARWNRQHATAQVESKDRRETAYLGLRQAVENFTKQVDTDSPMKMRNDWAHVAHALEASRSLARGITARSQLDIWSTQEEYCRRMTVSALITQEAFLEVLADDSSALVQFNHKPAEKHIALVIRWVLQLDQNVAGLEVLTTDELKSLTDRGLPLLGERILQWRNASLSPTRP
jgi:hypothetical protein